MDLVHENSISAISMIQSRYFPFDALIAIIMTNIVALFQFPSAEEHNVPLVQRV